jgi:hypothetical protein
MDDFTLDPSLALWLPLYEHRDGPAFTSKGQLGHLCTPTGPVWTTQGRSFDGVDDVIDLGISAALKPTLLTLSAVVNLSAYAAAGQSSIIVARTGANCYQLIVLPDGGGDQHKVQFSGWSGGVEVPLLSLDVLGLQQWHQLTVAADGITALLYIDGQLVNSTAMGALDTVGTNVYVGAFDGAGSNPFGGLISEVLLFNRAGTPAEITQQYVDARRRMPWL